MATPGGDSSGGTRTATAPTRSVVTRNACKSFADAERQQFDRGAALPYIYLEQF
jgi:hypothetical protein